MTFAMRHDPKLETNGTWAKSTLDGNPTAKVKCPGCGMIGTIINHSVGRNGVVSPSLDCPNDKCTFHENVILENWK